MSKESPSTSTLLDRLVGGGAHASVPEQIRVDECACDAIIAHGSFDHPDIPVRVHAHICGVLEFIEIDDATEAQPAPLSDDTELMKVSTTRADRVDRVDVQGAVGPIPRPRSESPTRMGDLTRAIRRSRAFNRDLSDPRSSAVAPDVRRSSAAFRPASFHMRPCAATSSCAIPSRGTSTSSPASATTPQSHNG